MPLGAIALVATLTAFNADINAKKLHPIMHRLMAQMKAAHLHEQNNIIQTDFKMIIKKHREHHRFRRIFQKIKHRARALVILLLALSATVLLIA